MTTSFLCRMTKHVKVLNGRGKTLSHLGYGRISFVFLCMFICMNKEMVMSANVRVAVMTQSYGVQCTHIGSQVTEYSSTVPAVVVPYEGLCSVLSAVSISRQRTTRQQTKTKHDNDASISTVLQYAVSPPVFHFYSPLY
jgi:hypothetical protein